MKRLHPLLYGILVCFVGLSGCSSSTEPPPDPIDYAVLLAGNWVSEQLFAGIDPEGIGVSSPVRFTVKPVSDITDLGGSCQWATATNCGLFGSIAGNEVLVRLRHTSQARGTIIVTAQFNVDGTRINGVIGGKWPLGYDWDLGLDKELLIPDGTVVSFRPGF
jgi:hypothetical protein